MGETAAQLANIPDYHLQLLKDFFDDVESAFCVIFNFHSIFIFVL